MTSCMTVMSPVCPLLCLSVSVVSIGLNCKVLQDSDVLKCREVGLFLEASPDRTHLEEPVCLSVSVFGDVPPGGSSPSFYSLSSLCSMFVTRVRPVTSLPFSEAQQQGFQVFSGSTFTISCSIQPQYPGGSFQLAFTSSITSHNYTQPAVNHSAHFLFPAAEPPTKEATAVFITSMFFLMTSPLRAVGCLSLSQIQQVFSSKWSSCR
ncbi:uncharacterized protein LOC119898490 [Micropterus salmoides]|uniref:uncharacterized protein LOC119898490 n=1 Tax=Micropterus salmoides TaxID=27706 RepID=UPI0018EABBCB|nr:uncharacterized protein LOC119898490 [Micropterus salmoides]